MTDHGPTWREVREATEQLALSELLVALDALDVIGVKSVVILGRLPQGADPSATHLSVQLISPAETTRMQMDLLVAAAVAGRAECYALIERMTTAPVIVKDPGHVSASELREANARFQDVARRLLTSPSDDADGGGAEQ
jgi:hypothetical protein